MTGLDAEARYAEAVELGKTPSAEAAARLVALLEDRAEVCIDEGSSIHDVDPTYAPVSNAAYSSLCRMPELAWPAIEAAWPTASVGARNAMLDVFKAQSFGTRARLPDEAHALLVEDAERVGATHALAIARWERAFAARARSGELADPEAFWRAAHGHPSPSERDRSFIPLASVVRDPVALARELIALIPRDDVHAQHLISALVRLPPVMPPELIASLIGSTVAQKHPETWAWIARHGEPARALVPLCVAALVPGARRGGVVSIPTTLDDRRWRLATEALKTFGPLTPDVRATLLDRLATTNEMMSLQGSLRRWLCELLGDAGVIEAELAPRLEEMEKSGDPVAVERVRQLRHRFAVMRGIKP